MNDLDFVNWGRSQSLPTQKCQVDERRGGVILGSEIGVVTRSPVVGVMQPYFFPYLGYFSHIYESDAFFLHDRVKYTKKGWINRNRILSPSGVKIITLPIAKDHDDRRIDERVIAATYEPMRQFLILQGSYGKAPFWPELKEFLPHLLDVDETSLFGHLLGLTRKLCELFEIDTEVSPVSAIGQFDLLRKEELVLSICEAAGAATYLNPRGGEALYSREKFEAQNMRLEFIDHLPHPYVQTSSSVTGHELENFVERLSVLDCLAECGLEETRRRIREDFVVTSS